ncbi:MAG: tRNA (adenosine(37)-N6)-dimethylallyltransferase MiaA, partial [Candidatus Weimeria sp.]
SMQVYRGMDIGTAKITDAQMQGIKHYGIDILEPDQNYDVTEFVSMARDALKQIYADHRIPILCGGTGFYIQALAYDIDFGEEQADPEYRKKLYDFARENGAQALHDRLSSVDPESAAAIPPGNVKRVIRAMEYYKNHGQKISEHNAIERKRRSPFELYFFVLTDDRQKLYDRIDRRVERMMDDGFLDEAMKIYRLTGDKECTASKAIGYRELFSFFRGECTLDQAVEKIKQDTRHFAKRQLTWFRRYPEVIWTDRQQYKTTDAIVTFMKDQIENKEEMR